MLIIHDRDFLDPRGALVIAPLKQWPWIESAGGYTHAGAARRHLKRRGGENRLCRNRKGTDGQRAASGAPQRKLNFNDKPRWKPCLKPSPNFACGNPTGKAAGILRPLSVPEGSQKFNQASDALTKARRNCSGRGKKKPKKKILWGWSSGAAEEIVQA